jgi:hypothetical protein
MLSSRISSQNGRVVSNSFPQQLYGESQLRRVRRTFPPIVVLESLEIFSLFRELTNLLVSGGVATQPVTVSTQSHNHSIRYADKGKVNAILAKLPSNPLCTATGASASTAASFTAARPRQKCPIVAGLTVAVPVLTLTMR